MLFVILIVLLLLAVFGMPNLGYHNYGWGPSGLLGVILIIILIFFVMGRRF